MIHKVGGPYQTTPDRKVLMLEYDGSNNPIYLGLAVPGTPTSAARWQIRKLTFDGSNNMTAMKYANGVLDFTSAWDDRASLSYS